jgi:hypothetical protein
MSPHTSPALLPVLFVPHGSPMFALNPGAAGAAMRALVPQLGSTRSFQIGYGQRQKLARNLSMHTTAFFLLS